jgi:hypothetical protein
MTPDASAGWQSLVLLSQSSPAGDSVLVEDPATLRRPDPHVPSDRCSSGPSQLDIACGASVGGGSYREFLPGALRC